MTTAYQRTKWKYSRVSGQKDVLLVLEAIKLNNKY